MPPSIELCRLAATTSGDVRAAALATLRAGPPAQLSASALTYRRWALAADLLSGGLSLSRLRETLDALLD